MRSFVKPLLFAAVALAVTPVRAEDGGGADKKGSKHKVTQSESYMTMDPIYATIVAGDRPAGLLMVGIGLDVPNEKLRAEADHAMPVLRDAYVRNMMAFAATQVRTSRQPDVTVIADRLQRVTDRALGRKGAKLLLAQVAIRLER